MLSTSKIQLPPADKISSNDPTYNGPFGPNLRYPATVLLGSFTSHGSTTTELQVAIEQFCKICVVRFGIPRGATEAIRDMFPKLRNAELPAVNSTELVDSRWEQFATTMNAPRPDELALDNLFSFRVHSPDQMEKIVAGAVELFKEFAQTKFHQVDHNTVESLKGKTELIRALATFNTEGLNDLTRSMVTNTHRQAVIAEKVGPEWTFIKSDERLWLNSCKICSQDIIIPALYMPQKPTKSPFTELQVNWIKPGGSIRWEPQLPNTRYTNTSLFGLSSIALEESQHASHPIATKQLIKTLTQIRQDYERSPTSEKDLSLQQERALLRALKKSEKG